MATHTEEEVVEFVVLSPEFMERIEKGFEETAEGSPERESLVNELMDALIGPPTFSVKGPSDQLDSILAHCPVGDKDEEES